MTTDKKRHFFGRQLSFPPTIYSVDKVCFGREFVFQLSIFRFRKQILFRSYFFVSVVIFVVRNKTLSVSMRWVPCSTVSPRPPCDMGCCIPCRTVSPRPLCDMGCCIPGRTVSPRHSVPGIPCDMGCCILCRTMSPRPPCDVGCCIPCRTVSPRPPCDMGCCIPCRTCPRDRHATWDAASCVA